MSSSKEVQEASSSTMFGTDRVLHVPVKKSLGSFPRAVGPAAEARELEYISSLHQNADRILRMDGTISNKDIAPYLMSRYGLKITPEQARDIALKLCGAKPRSDFSAEMDAIAEEEAFAENGEDTNEDDGNDDKEEPLYFDLVQLMSLLLIPELVQLQDIHSGDDKPLNPAVVKEPLAKDELIDTVMNALLETLDEDVRKDLLVGNISLDEELLSQMLESVGDIDAAANQELLTEMLKAMGGTRTPFTPESFLKALTSDVTTYSSKDKSASAKVPTKQTSTFYDVFGRNWEITVLDDGSDDNEKPTVEMGDAPDPIRTACFIDYAMDSYGSVVLNTSIWCLFLLSTLVYLQFFLNWIKATESGYLVCAEQDEYGESVYKCIIANKVVSWLLTAIFCGLYGIFFIVPASIGNVPGRTAWIYATFLVTALYAYAPFSVLIWYKQGIPHTTETAFFYEVVCPAWLGNRTVVKEWQQYYEERTDGAKNYLVFDDTCRYADDWCHEHPETLGKYIDYTPFWQTYDEFESCYNYSTTEGEFFDGLFYLQSGQSCEVFGNATCPNDGNCGLRSMANINDTLFEEDYICCHSGKSIYFESTRYRDAGHEQILDLFANSVCDDQPIGQQCTQEMQGLCEVGAICGIGGACEPDPFVIDIDKGFLGNPCNRSHDDCHSEFCWEGVCQQRPTVCPANELVSFLPGYRIDPFCRTKEEWCEYTDLPAIARAVKTYFEIDIDTCEDMISLLVNSSMLIVISEEDAELSHEITTAYHSDVETALVQDWTYFILLSIGVMGFFALLAILRKMFVGKTDARPRDYKIKLAGARKIANVIENAFNLHKQGKRSKGRVMRNFFLRGEQKVEVGGFFPTIKNVFNGTMNSSEGIMYPGRIWVGLVSQIVVTIVGLAFGAAFVKNTGDSIEAEREELSRHWTTADLKDLSNKRWATLTFDDLIVTPEEELLLEAYPERWQFDAAAIPGLFVGLCVAIFCILVYVPSTTNTIMKLRSGQMASLYDPYFTTLRKTPDNVIQNIGNMVFSLAGAAAAMAAIFFCLIFIFTYEHTRSFALGYVAIGIGIGVTMVVKIVGQKLLRARNFSSFYRKKPKSANYANLFFECWYIGTGVLVVVGRLVKFLISGALWLGRIDVEFLHPDVKILGIGLDKVPVSYKRDLLVHEAHNHPYIDRLGGMYLRRLRDGDEFGTVAGTTWRSLFVAGLMPWLVQHRVNTNEEAALEQMTDNSRRANMAKARSMRSHNQLDMSVTSIVHI